MARPKQQKVDIEALQLLVVSVDGVVNFLPLIAYTMKNCQATYAEIGEVFGITPSLAEYHVKEVKKALKNE